jgi:TATA-box binding protein (TBP) (component of TFIID and TFIIIB)
MLDDEWSQFINEGKISETLKNEPELMVGVPEPTKLYISTTTKIAYLNKCVDLEQLFFDLPVIEYSDTTIGVLKKIMKFTCTDADTLQRLTEKTLSANVDIISSNLSGSRLKFKDVRKISVGKCTKDIIQKVKKRSVFYNCMVIILRVRIQAFKEYHIKIFNTGKMEIPGIQSESEFDVVMQTLLQTLKSGFSIMGQADTVLINSNFNCSFYIKRDVLYDILKTEYGMQCVYDPCSYPGIQCEFYFDGQKETQTGLQDYDDIKGKGYGYCKGRNTITVSKMLMKKTGKYTEISVMIFRTGSILIVGMCNEEALYEVYAFFNKVLCKEYLRIKQDNPKCLPSALKNKRKKKYVSITPQMNTIVS